MGRWAGLCREENGRGGGPWPDHLGAGPTATPKEAVVGGEGEGWQNRLLHSFRDLESPSLPLGETNLRIPAS